ncbi:hypothetical protein FRC04_005635 [Tulasnella sp. 424]|nr:hypothetical protein FRC04_005635 [Tulasnella sp. 424]KAG8962187.1 hypothetical protein FRC05_005487 [Tulasnella sp. 425]
MPVFSKITTALSAVLALTSVVHAAPLQAAPAIPDYKLSTHRRNFGLNNVEFVSYHPSSSYKTFHNGDHSLLSRSANATHPFVPRAATTPAGVSPDVETAALEYCSQQTGMSKDSFRVRSGFTNDIGTTHVYLEQLLHGISVTNGVANIAFDKTGQVVAFGSSMVNPVQISSATPALSQSAAIKAAESSLGLTRLDSVPVTLSYVLQPDATDLGRKWAVLTHQFQLQNADVSKWVQAYVDATNAKTGEVVHVVDFVADAAYNVVEWSQQDPTWSGFKVLENPEDKGASPGGWVLGGSTAGNNVISVKLGNPPGPSRETAPGKFDYKWNSETSPETQPNLDVARTNAFYVVNKYHDVLYKYGFTEAAYNFQNNNYGKGGLGNDQILMSVQDASGKNNANFATPPDGMSGQCRMYTWTYTSPNRDGALENDIITHELTHGLTNRMTGGGTGRCLQTTEAGGMGEGWSDTVAFWSEQSSATYKDFTLGSWVMNKPAGIRSHPYSTNKNTNPLTYGDLQTKTEVHAIGEVWAMMLIEVYWALVAKYGFSNDNANPNQTQGNIVFLHLLVDALPLQPCNPTFLAARNAIIQADARRYRGVNKCLLWKAFAKRGLGVNAANYSNDFSAPKGC